MPRWLSSQAKILLYYFVCCSIVGCHDAHDKVNYDTAVLHARQEIVLPSMSASRPLDLGCIATANVQEPLAFVGTLQLEAHDQSEPQRAYLEIKYQRKGVVASSKASDILTPEPSNVAPFSIVMRAPRDRGQYSVTITVAGREYGHGTLVIRR